MKNAFLFLALMTSFSALADVVPCEPGENICESRPWTDTIRMKAKTVYSRGVGMTYASAEEAANNRLYKTHRGIDCGIGVALAVKHDEIRLRDGRMAQEVWVRCSPPSEAYSGGSRRIGTMLCGPGGKGCIIVK
jgi:hypothetical protein